MNKVADKQELLMVLDNNGNSTERLEKRSIVHDKELWHNEVALWVINPKTKEVLMQRRSPNKRINPNKLGICAGHVVENDSIEETLKTEAKEEIGIDLIKYDVRPLVIRRREEPQNHNFSHNFYILAEIPLTDFVIQEEELSELIYLDYETLKNMSKQTDNETVFKFEKARDVFDALDKIIYNL